MKSTKKINQEIEELLKKEPTTRLKTRVSFLRQCIRYLETEPSEAFLAEEIVRIKNQVDVLERRFDEWLGVPKRKSLPNPKGSYYAQVGMSKLQNQLKTLKYLYY
jgi:NAD-specific glutamate dehydrogenase